MQQKSDNYNEILASFLEKNKSKIASHVNLNHIKCQILTTSEQDLKIAAEYIKQGKLVAFPTETVYGLGANALNLQSVRKIFETKRRPLSDPVIVHINELSMHEKLVKFEDQEQQQLFQKIAKDLWPGPLTTILRANFDVLDKILTAQTDYVGIRMPKEPIALQLIKYAQTPIAAPSANLFAHVSPSQAIHVFNDFYDQDIAIIDGPHCQCGVESTVLKVTSKSQIDILRLGSYSEAQIYKEIEEYQKNSKSQTKIAININTKKQAHTGENQEAPGQLLKHYSPKQESFMLILANNISEKQLTYINNSISSQQQQQQQQQQMLVEVAEEIINLKKKMSDNFDLLQMNKEINLKKCVVLDFNGINEVLKDKCLKYMPLAEKKTDDFFEVMNNLYDLLREAENTPGVENILIAYLKRTPQQLENLEFFQTIYDKIYRCTSGKKVIYNPESDTFFSFSS